MDEYIDKSAGRRLHELHTISKFHWFNIKGKTTCLSVGSGAGNEEIDLINRGWKVTAVDITSHSEEVMRSRLLKGQQNNLEFLLGDIQEVNLRKKYNYILALNVLPFIGNFVSVIAKLKKLSKKECIYTMTFFGPNHGIKNTTKTTVTKLKCLFKSMNLIIRFIERVEYDQKNGVHWDAINVILSNF
jgi:2-polyprenyl-3-methyl-5-hydroxy-6-metoxy-1,4-benzoquinol methylase